MKKRIRIAENNGNCAVSVWTNGWKVVHEGNRASCEKIYNILQDYTYDIENMWSSNEYCYYDEDEDVEQEDTKE